VLNTSKGIKIVKGSLGSKTRQVPEALSSRTSGLCSTTTHPLLQTVWTLEPLSWTLQDDHLRTSYLYDWCANSPRQVNSAEARAQSTHAGDSIQFMTGGIAGLADIFATGLTSRKGTSLE